MVITVMGVLSFIFISYSVLVGFLYLFRNLSIYLNNLFWKTVIHCIALILFISVKLLSNDIPRYISEFYYLDLNQIINLLKDYHLYLGNPANGVDFFYLFNK